MAPASPASAPETSARPAIVVRVTGTPTNAARARVGADRAHREAERRVLEDAPTARPRGTTAYSSPVCTRVRSMSLPSCSSSGSATLCGQPIAVGSFIGPSSIIDTNSRTMKLRSSVVTTSSTPSRARRSAGTTSSSAPATIAATIIAGNRTSRAADDAAHRHRGERAGVKLPFRADVVEVRAERDRRRQAGEDERRGARERLAPREARAEAALEDQRVRAPDRRAGPGDEQRRGDERERDRRERRGDEHHARHLAARLKPHESRLAGARHREADRGRSHSAVGFASASDRPAWITAMRSASA